MRIKEVTPNPSQPMKREKRLPLITRRIIELTNPKRDT